MSTFWPLWQREMGSYFRTSLAYVAGVFFLLVTGSSFWMLISRLAREPADGDLSALLFGSPWFWLAMLVVTPLLTMRLFSEERRMGTLETLMTAPVTETEVVLAKFAGAYSLFLLLWLPTLAYGVVLRWSGALAEAPAWGPVPIAFLGTALVGAAFLATGLLCSLMTRHQAVAAMSCLTLLGLLLAAGWLAPPSTDGRVRLLAHFISSPRHMTDFASGVIDTRAVFWYLSVTLLLLFVAIRILEGRRLR